MKYSNMAAFSITINALLCTKGSDTEPLSNGYEYRKVSGMYRIHRTVISEGWTDLQVIWLESVYQHISDFSNLKPIVREEYFWELKARFFYSFI